MVPVPSGAPASLTSGAGPTFCKCKAYPKQSWFLLHFELLKPVVAVNNIIFLEVTVSTAEGAMTIEQQTQELYGLTPEELGRV